jgi:hypothetical protein
MQSRKAFRRGAISTTYTRPKIGADLSPQWRNPPGAGRLYLAPMPLEGHYRTVNTPLRRLTPRERNVLIAGLLVTAVALLALLFVPAHNESPLLDEHGGAHSGCIEVAVAGRVGAEPIVGCGGRARQICSRAAAYDVPRSVTITETCREAGVRF